MLGRRGHRGSRRGGVEAASRLASRHGQSVVEAMLGCDHALASRHRGIEASRHRGRCPSRRRGSAGGVEAGCVEAESSVELEAWSRPAGRGTVDQATGDGATCQKGQVECTRLLLEAGAAVGQARTVSGATPLFAACQNGQVECIRLPRGGAPRWTSGRSSCRRRLASAERRLDAAAPPGGAHCRARHCAPALWYQLPARASISRGCG